MTAVVGVHSLASTGSHPVLAAERDAVLQRLRALAELLTVVEERFADEPTVEPVLSQAHRVAQRAAERLRLSATHTVVALAGSTGSGKSSLFNALTGLELSRVGYLRPTTSVAKACTWGPKGADELLDWLGVDPRQRVARESALDADAQAELRGLVLLDLPDHDSMVKEHRRHAERIIERADMLVWVADPQKYADGALHEHLCQLAGRDAIVVVILQQIDLLTPAELAACQEHLASLLAADGLPDARIMSTSALRGDGLSTLRALLLEAVTARVASMRRLGGDLDEVATNLRTLIAVDPAPPVGVSLLVADLTSAISAPALAIAAGRDYRQRASTLTSWPVARWVSRWLWPNALRRLHLHVGGPEPDDAATGLVMSVAKPQVESAAAGLAGAVSASLPQPWSQSIRRAATTEVDALTERLSDEANGASDEPLPGWFRVVAGAQWILLAALLTGAVWLLGWSIGAAIGWSLPDPLTLEFVPLPVWLVLIGLVGGPVLEAYASWFVTSGELRVRAARVRALDTAVSDAAEAHVVNPVRAELDDYQRGQHALTNVESRGG